MITRYVRLLFAICLLIASARAQGFVNFESPQSHPIALSADGLRLYVVNTPDHKLGVYSLAVPGHPILIREVAVGLEPISVAVRTRDEVWVVNHVSDSICVVDVSRGVVLETIQVGDEPGDIVFGGNPQRAFVTSMTERRVLVLDPKARKQVGSIPVFGDDPRSLLVSADGKTVWVAITRSGNMTTIVPHTIAPLPPKPTNTTLPLAPKQGIIVRSDDPTWKSKLNVTLPDHDVVEIDTATMKVRRNYPGVGTILFNLGLRPGTNELWVANTHSLNLVRFEPALRGHAIDTRVTTIATGATPKITAVDLNPGINYATLPNAPAHAAALSQVTDVAFDSSGKVAYVASFGTDRIGVLDASGKVMARIEIGDTPGNKIAPRTKRGPRALIHHPSQGLLYVLNRLSNSLSVVDTTQKKVLREISMFDPTPKSYREGRGFLYDAKLSGNGTMSCASCHVDGRTDGLAWDLGDPGGKLFNNGTPTPLHPMKGPLMTQTLQGFKNERLFHWRADKPGLVAFNVAFPDLMGGSALGSADLATFVGFMQDIRFMPTPHRNLDDTLPTKPIGSSAKDGETMFRTKKGVAKDGKSTFRCIDCHGNVSGSGTFGFQGLIGQQTRASQLRGLYKKDGRIKGSQGRTSGFGYGADGSKDDIADLLSTTSRFNPLTTTEKKAFERFLFAFPSGTAPSVGLSRTVTKANLSTHAQDLLLLIAQAQAGKNDLIVKGLLDNQAVGFFYDKTSRRFEWNRKSMATVTIIELINALSLSNSILTFTGVPPGLGFQLGIDRDADGIRDGDEGLSGYGAATPPCASTLALTANSPPRIGNNAFALVTSGAPTKAPGLLLFSAKQSKLGVLDLDILVDLNSLVLLQVASDSRGEVIYPLPLPADNKLVGVRLFFQTVVLAPCGQLNLAASSGLEVKLGL